MVTQPIANDTATDIFVDLDATSIALLLDVDGTLIDIAPSPNEVHVSSDLQQSLARLLQLTGGALALVSGRPIADLDRLFAPLMLPAIGGHGAEMRRHGLEVTHWADPLPPDLRRQLAGAATPGSVSMTSMIRSALTSARGTSMNMNVAIITAVRICAR